MKERIGISIVLLIALFGLVPPLFSEGGVFAVKGMEYVYKDILVEVPDIYADNAFFTLIYLLISWVGISLPFILPKLKRVWCFISQFFGSWFFATFLYEVFNFSIPDVVLNSSEDRTLFTKFSIAFIIGLSFTMIRETWQKTNSK